MPEVENIVDQIAKALQSASVLPYEKRLWNIERICEYFDVKESTVHQRIVCQPTFPDPIKVEGGPLRWVAGEVIQWAESCRREKRKKVA